MEKEQIITTFSDWNFWTKDLDTGINRFYLKFCLDVVKSKANKILVITGVRRSGKSFLAKQIIKEIIKEVGRKNSLIVNFEEVSFDEKLDEKFLIKVWDAYKEIVKPEKRPIIVLDEIQRVTNWERFVRTLQEKNEAKIIITGSSAKLMSEELATLLTGRTIDLKVFPFSFQEFLCLKNIKAETKLEILARRDEILKLLREYFEFGGFPEVILEEKEEIKKAILKKIKEDIIFQDVVRRFKIKEIEKLERLSNFYTSNMASPITFNKVSKFLKLPVKTVEKYSKNLETSNLFFFVKRFSFSLKEQENSPRKVYLIDNGIFTVSAFKLTENYGRMLENLVAVELKRRGKEVFYYKSNNKEVDFVVKNARYAEKIIQVCYDISEYGAREREIKSLIKASESLKCKDLLIITWDLEDEIKVENNRIKFLPLWKWLLEGNI
jgi:predicted AAA+ superfamily ATPase